MTQMVPIIVEMMMKTTTMPAIKSGDNIFKTRCNKRDVGRVQRLWNVICHPRPPQYPLTPPPPSRDLLFTFQHLGWAYARGAQASSFSGTSTGTLRKPDQTSSVSSFSWEQSAFEWWQCLSWGSTPKGRQKSRWRPRFVGFQVFLNRYSLRFVVVEKIYFLSQKCWKSVLTSLWTVLL